MMKISLGQRFPFLPVLFLADATILSNATATFVAPALQVAGEVHMAVSLNGRHYVEVIVRTPFRCLRRVTESRIQLDMLAVVETAMRRMTVQETS